MPFLRVKPQKGMFDSAVSIICNDLAPRQRVTFVSRVSIGNERFSACAHYEATERGEVDCTAQPSLGGMFSGYHPMGLFWSVHPESDQKQGLRFMPRDISRPIFYEISCFNGHLQSLTEAVSATQLAVCTCERNFLAPCVSKTSVRAGTIRGTLFLPSDNNEPNVRFPAIIDMYGTAGGLLEYRAGLLASWGFAVLALPYFRYDDLPETIESIDFQYFLDAINWLSSHPKVVADRIGVVGISMGADLAINMAIHSEKVKAAISINGFHMWDPFCQIMYKGEKVPVSDGDVSNIEFDSRGGLLYSNFKRKLHTDDNRVFPVEKSCAHYLFLCSDDDQSNPSVYSAKQWTARLDKAGKADQYEMCIFPEAGHILEPPYMPVCTSSFHRVVGGIMVWGGKMTPHAQAQELMWKKIITHFATYVGNPVPVQRNFMTGQSNL